MVSGVSAESNSQIVPCAIRDAIRVNARCYRFGPIHLIIAGVGRIENDTRQAVLPRHRWRKDPLEVSARYPHVAQASGEKLERFVKGRACALAVDASAMVGELLTPA